MMDRRIRSDAEYAVHLDQFEGPLDLLLYCVSKSEVEIADVSVSQITRQYLEYLDMMRDFNIIVASEYLNMAATLLRLKAQELLPDMAADENFDDGDAFINRAQLIAKLIEYKKFKEAAGSLKIFESEHLGCYTRGMHEDIDNPTEQGDVDLGNLTFFDLVKAFRAIMERAKDVDPGRGHVLMHDDVKLDDRVEIIMGMVEDGGEVPFEALFSGDVRKMVLVVTFMALLELVKMKMVNFRQEEHGSQIFVCKRTDGAALEPVLTIPDIPTEH